MVKKFRDVEKEEPDDYKIVLTTKNSSMITINSLNGQSTKGWKINTKSENISKIFDIPLHFDKEMIISSD